MANPIIAGVVAAAAYIGYRFVKRALSQASQAMKDAEQGSGQQPNRARTPKTRNIPTLRQDPKTGVYRPNETEDS